VRGKSVVLILLILTMATFAAANINAYAHTDPLNYVKLYLWNPPAGSNTFTPQPSGINVPTWLFIDSPASWYNTAQGIVSFTASLRVDPNVVTVQTAAPMPDNNWDGRPDSFLGMYAASQGYFTLWVGGTVDAAKGTITEPAEAIQGFTTLGKGAGGGPAPLCMFIIQTKSGVDHTTAYSLLHLFDCYYTTPDGVKHPVDIVKDGHYGTPPPQFYMSGPPAVNFKPATITDPIGTAWHELYPNYCHNWDLTSFNDNGDGYLSASDQIDMMNETGWTYWFHVDIVTVTIHWTFKEGPEGPETGELGVAEPAELTEYTIENPIGTAWHQIYPVYCKDFVITSWIDNDDSGTFNPSDQFDFEYLGEGVTNWAHLDEVTTDMTLSQKGEPEGPTPEFPLGLEIMMMIAAAMPIVYIWRTRKWRGKK